MNLKSVIIVGAGPTGLTAAVELARRGIIPRVIDKKSRASTQSRAVGINPRTLHLLSESGVDQALIQKGVLIRRAIFHIGVQPVFELDLGLAPKPYDFLLALPQDETEESLTAWLESYGVGVEYGTEFDTYSIENGRVSALLKKGGERESAEFDLMLGADGIHSRVRQSAGIEFGGIELDDKWGIVDFDSTSWPHKNEICLFFFEHGRVCLIVPIGVDRYRGVCDRPNAVENLPEMLEIDNIRRTGEFKISIRQAETYQKGPVFIAGDAAHCHSPVGGRGMNVGMGDGAAFAKLFADGELSSYTEYRHGVAKDTIRFSERGRKIAMSTSRFLKPALLKTLPPILLRSRKLHQKIVRFILDCPDV